jgi:hypothetical protein
MSAVVLKKPDQAEMLAELARAVNLENASQEARAAHDRLKASIWTAEDRDRGRELGREAIALKAKDIRSLWRKEATKLIVDNYDAGNYLFRAGLIRGLHSFCVVYGYKGKGGGNIQIGTISRWLTEEVEAEIRLDAISSLIEMRKDLA